ncbi:unnamed protein product [Periconia digitata]|uniref:Protein kinase domain-containing protein n=1 Tax=Periconia digitata TaxID=1303443 RepID=A0A9W4U874_9PLEO|nr:unnamed protein product [Periconia digitata]
MIAISRSPWRVTQHIYVSKFFRPQPVRYTSALVGRSGRLYGGGEPTNSTNDELAKLRPDITVSVIKTLDSRKRFDKYLSIAEEIGKSDRLRLPIDFCDEESTIVLPWYQDTLFGFVESRKGKPHNNFKGILRQVMEAVQELHSKGWAHLDIKPQNIFVDPVISDDGQKTVTNVALGDFHNAAKIGNGSANYYPGPLGQPVWRSIEMHTGQFVCRASDIYALGLLLIYTYGGRSRIFLDGMTLPQVEIICHHLIYFGPAIPKDLLAHVENETWRKLLEIMSGVAVKQLEARPECSFSCWGNEFGPTLKGLISEMTNLNPLARPTIEQVLAHKWWDVKDGV